MTTPAVAIHPRDSAAPADRSPRLGDDADQRRAKRFFWTVLILATCASVAGNVTHAILNATHGTAPIAAAVAMVPPAVLLASTHGVAVLVRVRAAAGFIYWCAMMMTIGLAVCAFILSFDALRDLAVAAGIRASLAWLWPLVIDLSIAQTTMALLSLSRCAPNPSEPEPATSHRPHLVYTAPEPAAEDNARELSTPTEADPAPEIWPPGERALTVKLNAARHRHPAPHHRLSTTELSEPTVIRCDGEACGTVEDADETVPEHSSAARHARGWRSEGSNGSHRRDYCPKCARSLSAVT